MKFIEPVSFEGPDYADRVGGKLTFLDWDHWTESDKETYREAYAIAQEQINERFSREMQSGERVIVGLRDDT